MRAVTRGVAVMAIAASVVAYACTNADTKKTDSAAQPGAATAVAAIDPATACTLPTTVAKTPEETAWRLFVAATCPVNADKYPYVVWENWIEQDQLYGGGALTAGVRPRFHGSPLRAFMRMKAASAAGRPAPMSAQRLMSAAQNCDTSSFSGRVICEEVRIDPTAAGYIKTNGLTTQAGLLTFAKSGKPFQFPPPAIEVKVDWIQLASCTGVPTNVHIEQVGSTCYALGGMHLISKLIDKWVWATFEPQNDTTNPRRCQQLGCNDAWGSNPATSKGPATQLTPSLAALMAAAKLAPEWTNYRLDGVQIDFTDTSGKPIKLGNSVIEGENAGGPPQMDSSSCITCHQFSTIRTDGQQAMSPNFLIGNPNPLPAGMIPRDFVWSFLLAR